MSHGHSPASNKMHDGDRAARMNLRRRYDMKYEYEIRGVSGVPAMFHAAPRSSLCWKWIDVNPALQRDTSDQTFIQQKKTMSCLLSTRTLAKICIHQCKLDIKKIDCTLANYV